MQGTRASWRRGAASAPPLASAAPPCRPLCVWSWCGELTSHPSHHSRQSPARRSCAHGCGFGGEFGRGSDFRYGLSFWWSSGLVCGAWKSQMGRHSCQSTSSCAGPTQSKQQGSGEGMARVQGLHTRGTKGASCLRDVLGARGLAKRLSGLVGSVQQRTAALSQSRTRSGRRRCFSPSCRPPPPPHLVLGALASLRISAMLSPGPPGMVECGECMPSSLGSRPFLANALLALTFSSWSHVRHLHMSEEQKTRSAPNSRPPDVVVLGSSVAALP